MSDKIPFLSICIPTYKRVEITRETIKSIYADSVGIDMTEFEVIVSDNDPEQSSKVFEEEFHYSNFHYHVTKCEGFLNSYYVLQYGAGEFLKLQNNVSRFRKGSLAYLIKEIKELSKNRPVIYFTNGMLHHNSIKTYSNIDDFFSNLNYFSSWSAGFGIWKEDFQKIGQIKINRWFPQTTLLIKSSIGKNSYFIDDHILREGEPVAKKGGYNPFEVFGESFLDIFNDALKNGLIKSSTFISIKKKLFKDYLASRYLKTVILRKDSFDHNDIRSHLRKYYGNNAIIKLILFALTYPLRKR